jgi:hypothetical protein
MKTSRNIAWVVAGGIVGFVVLAAILCHQQYPPPLTHPVQSRGDLNRVHAHGDLNTARSFQDAVTTQSDKELDPNVMAAIFPPSSASIEPHPTYDGSGAEFSGSGRISRKTPILSEKRPPLPKDWESFDKQYAPEQKIGHPIVSVLENGTYQVDELLYSIKLLEKQLNVEYRLNNLEDYDPRTKANAFDNILNQTSMKTDVRVDTPIGAYVGVRMVIKFW